ncbi:MAG: thymidylate kinase [Clostridia bacterium]|nr:thymidylate kinase [Clostridia bacterium]
MLIALDGLDGSGKETQTRLLLEEFRKRGIPHRYLSFPTYDPEGCAAVNMYLNGRFGDNPDAVNGYAASSFFAVDRYCSYKLDWKKDYDAGAWIIANRYTTANAVHQLSKLPLSEADGFLDWLYDFEFGKLGLPRPDLVFYLCMPPEISEAMIVKRAHDTGHKEDIHEKSKEHLANSYRAALYSAEKLGWETVHCDDPHTETGMRTRESIHAEIMDRLRARFPVFQED